MTRVKNSNTLDRIESERIDFFHRVREYYLRQVREYPERYKIIDATQSKRQVEQGLHEILAAII